MDPFPVPLVILGGKYDLFQVCIWPDIAFMYARGYLEVRFQVFALLKIMMFFWVMTLSRVVGRYQHFR
jgi:hypothetical protein